MSRETPESLLLKQDAEQRIQAAIEAAPLIFREVLLLCDVEELSYLEIAGVLGVPIGTVMSRLYRARKALRAALEDKRKESGMPQTFASSGG